MPRQAILALPQFLRFLSAHPGADEVMHALVRGPLARYGAVDAALWRVVGDRELRLVGSYNNSAASVQRYSVIPLNVKLPSSDCFLADRIMGMPLADLPGAYPLLALDQELWGVIRSSADHGELVDCPVPSAGCPIGVVGFDTDRPFTPDLRDTSFLTGVMAALGMWLSHPATHLTEPEWLAAGETETLALTDRQQAILRLVLNGSSNPSIADELGYSRSTVKQELRRAMVSMHAGNRLVAAERAWELGLLGSVAPPSPGEEEGR